jgi:peptidoglycan/xylan/chitin deacetylase (PgdA/CDA1 family)
MTRKHIGYIIIIMGAALGIISLSTTLLGNSGDQVITNVEDVSGVMITFDDGLESHSTKAYEYMRTIDAHATTYIITSRIGKPGYLDIAQLQEMNANGWSIANHTSIHKDPLTSFTQSEVETQLTDARDALNSLGLTRASAHVAYPWGIYNQTVLDAMETTGMLTGRAVWTGDGNSNFRIYCADAGHGDTNRLAIVKGWVDDAVAKKSTLCLVFHNIVDSDPIGQQWQTGYFKDLIDYIAEKNLQFFTINDYADKLGSISGYLQEPDCIPSQSPCQSY